MKHILITYPNDGRKIKQFLTPLLKKKLISSAKVINYAKSYTLDEGKIKKDEEKIILIYFLEEKETELISLIKKLHPNKEINIECIKLEVLKN